jgi:hypothetical protein
MTLDPRKRPKALTSIDPLSVFRAKPTSVVEGRAEKFGSCSVFLRFDPEQSWRPRNKARSAGYAGANGARINGVNPDIPLGPTTEDARTRRL